jgi:hypothetical protein
MYLPTTATTTTVLTAGAGAPAASRTSRGRDVPAGRARAGVHTIATAVPVRGVVRAETRGRSVRTAVVARGCDVLVSLPGCG